MTRVKNFNDMVPNVSNNKGFLDIFCTSSGGIPPVTQHTAYVEVIKTIAGYLSVTMQNKKNYLFYPNKLEFITSILDQYYSKDKIEFYVSEDKKAIYTKEFATNQLDTAQREKSKKIINNSLDKSIVTNIYLSGLMKQLTVTSNQPLGRLYYLKVDDKQALPLSGGSMDLSEELMEEFNDKIQKANFSTNVSFITSNQPIDIKSIGDTKSFSDMSKATGDINTILEKSIYRFFSFPSAMFDPSANNNNSILATRNFYNAVYISHCELFVSITQIATILPLIEIPILSYDELFGKDMTTIEKDKDINNKTTPKEEVVDEKDKEETK